MSDSRGAALAIRRHVEAAARFVRLFAMGATILFVMVGMATGSSPVTPAVAAWAVATGVLFHVFADVGNDVADLPIDRTDPRRRAGPLVGGAIAPPAALLVALAAAGGTLALLYVGDADAALGPLVAALGLIGAYNLAGKSVPVPVVADLVQGCGWAALVVAGAAAAGGVTPPTWWAAAAVVIYIAMVNGIHGAVRDVVNDRRAGAHTTAALLGADVIAGQTVVIPPGLARWGVALQAAFCVTLVGLVAAGPARDGWGWAWTVAAAVVFGASCVTLGRAHRARGDLRWAMALGTWHLFLLPASLLAAAARLMSPWLAVVAGVAFLVPPWAYGRAVRGTEFGVPSTTHAGAQPVPAPSRLQRARALWRMTRAGNAVAAAAVVALGGWYGGRLTARLVPLMAATAAAVAAANVFNDRCDRRVDAVNRPERPLVAGLVTDNEADKFVLAAALVTMAAAALVGVTAAVASSVLLVAGLAYSAALRLPVVGHLTVAVLFATPVLLGGWLGAGVVHTEHWYAAALAVLFLFARETLKGVPDRVGDLSAGYGTIATWLGEQGALRVFRAAALALCAVSIGIFFVTRDVGYLVAALVCTVAPTVRTLWMVGGVPSRRVVDEAVAFSGLIVASGLVPLLLLP